MAVRPLSLLLPVAVLISFVIMPHHVSWKAHALAHIHMNESLADTDAGDTRHNSGGDNLESVFRCIAAEVHGEAVGVGAVAGAAFFLIVLA